MGFVLRALFWIAVVGSFMPRDLASEPFPPHERAAPVSGQISGAHVSISEFCESNREVCAAGKEAVNAARSVALAALEAAHDALLERETLS